MRELPISPEEFKAFKRSVFDDAVTDWWGVYEVLWAANGAFPDIDASDRLYVTERAVAELLESGLLKLYRGEFGSLSERAAVHPAEYAAALRDWNTWAIPQGPKVFIAAEEPPDRETWQRIHDSL